MIPTPKQINEYALKRWAEENEATDIVYTPIESKDIGDYTIDTFEYIDTPSESGAMGIINRAFFAKLPMDEEEAFYAHLFEIAGVAHSNKQFEWFNAILKAPIGDLLLAYYKVGNE